MKTKHDLLAASLLHLASALGVSAAVRYVDANSPGASPPYTTWASAARIIQNAVDVADPGDEIVVTNGIYAAGGRAVGTNVLVNRVAVDKPLTLRSVNGPQVTVIQGDQVPGTINGDGAIRCVYLANGASLSGFTLRNGATRLGSDWPTFQDSSGGGVWCESANASVSNCVVVSNSAWSAGGGAYGGTLTRCTLTGNSAADGGGSFLGRGDNCILSGNSAGSGGGSWVSWLNNCVLTGNSAGVGGGTLGGMLNNCTVVGNTGGGASGLSVGPFDPVFRCILINSILCFNTSTADESANHGLFTTLNYCCTTPLPPDGIGNITNAPLFVNLASGNLRLQSNSPCINAGNNACTPGSVDLEGNPRIVSGAADIGACEFQGSGSMISYAWLQQFGLPTDASADATDRDADGYSTWREWRCQTDPTNPLSVLRLLSASLDGTNLTVTWQSASGVNYFLERGANLAATPCFSPLATNIPGQPDTTTYTDTNALGPSPFFYRVGVQTPEFAYPEALASTQWLEEHLRDASVRIVDARYPQSDAAFRSGHIPGAVKVDPAIDLRDPNAAPLYLVPTPSQFQALMGRLGISNTTTVVVYDTAGGLWCARLWWALRYYGHQNVKLLHGGLGKWQLERRPMEQAVVLPPPATFTAQAHPELRATFAEVQAAVGSPKVIILDALSVNQHTGTAPDMSGLPAGHIPSAKNVPAPSNLDANSLVRSPPESLAAVYAQAGVTLGKPVITYCGGGYYGAFSLFVLYQLGYQNVRLYDGSWIEWVSRGSPIETGP